MESLEPVSRSTSTYVLEEYFVPLAVLRRIRPADADLIDGALDVGGSCYLPYQLHATEAQFRRAYPRAAELFALVKRLDPTSKFGNMRWDRYDRP